MKVARTGLRRIGHPVAIGASAVRRAVLAAAAPAMDRRKYRLSRRRAGPRRTVIRTGRGAHLGSFLDRKRTRRGLLVLLVPEETRITVARTSRRMKRDGNGTLYSRRRPRIEAERKAPDPFF